LQTVSLLARILPITSTGLRPAWIMRLFIGCWLVIVLHREAMVERSAPHGHRMDASVSQEDSPRYVTQYVQCTRELIPVTRCYHSTPPSTDLFPRSANLQTGLYILPSEISSSFFKSTKNVAANNHWADFHDLLTVWKVFAWIFSIRTSFCNSSRDVAMATDFGQNLRNDLYSTRWHFETYSIIAISIQKDSLDNIVSIHTVQIWSRLVQ